MTTTQTTGKVERASGAKKPTLKERLVEAEAKLAEVEAAKAKGTDWVTIGICAGAALSTVVVSMILNVRAFTGRLDMPDPVATSVGIAIPIWVLVLTFIAHRFKGTVATVKGWDVPVISIGAYLLAAFALIVSLPHLAAGFSAWHLRPYEAWSLAIVTDLLQVIAKAGIIACIGKK